jgi:SRSO17 transposase
MTKPLPVPPAPAPLEAYAQHFDPLFAKRSQRAAFRRYLEGLLLAAERNKTLTALANTEPIVGAQRSQAQRLQWFLSESTWDPQAVNAQRLALLRTHPRTAPSAVGALIIDESGDRKAGTKTAHVGRQYLANVGKIDNGVVSVSSLWADEHVYYPVEVEPYTPARYFARGKLDPQFRTKPQIAVQLVQQAVALKLSFRAVVADCFYGEHDAFKQGLRDVGVGYVLALQPSHAWWHPVDEPGTLWEVAQAAGWCGPDAPGAWVKVERRFRDGHTEAWWAVEIVARPYGPAHGLRAVVATTDPATLPDLTTWYLETNLPAPGPDVDTEQVLAAADLAEVVRLYSLRMWVEQSYKQIKHTLGWAQYQVRSDVAIRRHWALVYCAFSFCWWHVNDPLIPDGGRPEEDVAAVPSETAASDTPAGQKKVGGSTPVLAHR